MKRTGELIRTFFHAHIYIICRVGRGFDVSREVPFDRFRC
jgi:hypothetical protein